MKLHPKIQELKQRSAPITFSNIGMEERGGLLANGSDFEKRILAGYLFVWNVPNLSREVMIKGSCAKSLEARGVDSNAKYKITMLWQHKQDDPIGMFDELYEDDYGLRFRTKPLDDVPNADRAIKQIQSGTINQFSGGFKYVWDKMEYDENSDLIIMKEINLFEGSVATIGDQQETFVIRSLDQLEDLTDDTEDFINTIPRSLQLQARNLFARHKSLVDFEPLEQRMKTLEKHEPNEDKGKKIDYSYLLQNFKP